MRILLPILCLIAACSKGPEADLPSIGAARSVAAEWALVNELAARGKLTQIYTQTMRKNVREQLKSAFSSLTEPHSRYGAEIQALLAQPDDAAPEQLRPHVEELKRIENQLESA